MRTPRIVLKQAVISMVVLVAILVGATPASAAQGVQTLPNGCTLTWWNWGRADGHGLVVIEASTDGDAACWRINVKIRYKRNDNKWYIASSGYHDVNKVSLRRSNKANEGGAIWMDYSDHNGVNFGRDATAWGFRKFF